MWQIAVAAASLATAAPWTSLCCVAAATSLAVHRDLRVLFSALHFGSQIVIGSLHEPFSEAAGWAWCGDGRHARLTAQRNAILSTLAAKPESFPEMKSLSPVIFVQEKLNN